ELQSAIDLAFGANKITVGLNGSALQFDPVGSAGNLPQVTVSAVSGNGGIAALGFTDGQSYKIKTDVTLGAIAAKFATPLTFGDFYINGQKITYSSSDTLQDLINKVNSSAAGVTMSYDVYSDKISFTTKGTGAAAKVQLQDGSAGNFIAAMNLDTNVVSGADADVTIDNVQYFRSTNSLTVNGVTYNLAATASNLSISIGRDTDAMFDKIKGFVDKYNETVKAIDGKRYEPKFKDYPPLTDEQKSEMKDEDIKLWEEKAKSGLLHGDSILSNISRNLRALLSATIQNASSGYDALYKIGITTAPYDAKNPQNAGTLVIDEDKLRAALAADPDGVANLFNNFPGASPVAAEKGIAFQMYDQITSGINDLIEKAGLVGGLTDDITNELGEQVHDLQNDIDLLQVKLNDKEDYYYRQFTAMEQAIQKANSISMYLMSIQ
ncbi:MAG TPA: flagellar filament capping protein FliD, partial [Bacilli bacterium]